MFISDFNKEKSGNSILKINIKANQDAISFVYSNQNQIVIILNVVPVRCSGLAEPITATYAKANKKGCIGGESIST